jgi:hypothetical protein
MRGNVKATIIVTLAKLRASVMAGLVVAAAIEASLVVMPALVAGIHAFLAARRGWHPNSGLPEYGKSKKP